MSQPFARLLLALGRQSAFLVWSFNLVRHVLDVHELEVEQVLAIDVALATAVFEGAALLNLKPSSLFLLKEWISEEAELELHVAVEVGVITLLDCWQLMVE